MIVVYQLTVLALNRRERVHLSNTEAERNLGDFMIVVTLRPD